MDVPHSASIEPAERRDYSWLHPDSEGHLLMKIALVEASTKRLLHLRAFTLDPVFSAALRRCVAVQARHTGSVDDYRAAIKRAYAVFNSSDHIAHAALVSSRSGG